MKNVLMISVAIALLICPGTYGASVGDVAAWDVGSGQPNGNFVRDYIQWYSSGELQYQIEFAMRAQERYVGPYTPVYDNTTNTFNYTVPAGVNGTAALWNFDLSVNVWVKPGSIKDNAGWGQIDDLTKLSLYITSDNGMAPVIVDLLDPQMRAAVDAHTIPAMGGDPADPTHFYQFSQNLSWWSAGFDPFAVGTYNFTIDLDSVAGDYPGEVFGPLMSVTVVPEPATMLLLGLGGLLCRRCKRA
jgi:hypothetical protein